MSQIVHTNRTRISFAAVALMALAALAIGFDRASAQAEGEELRVGTYQPQQAFQMYHRTAAFQQEMQELQAQAQETEPEQLAQLQQQAEQMQQEVIQQFERDVKNAVPEIAEQANVDLVAVEVVYTAPGVEQEDVTESVVEKINEGAEAPAQNELPALPGR
ncbi:MAG: OmpH family outer membrane protein [Phycisphaeraceae bacterium]